MDPTTPFTLRCIICGCSNQTDSNYCTQCGWRLALTGIQNSAAEALRAQCVARLAKSDRSGYCQRHRLGMVGAGAMTVRLVRVGGAGLSGRSTSGPLLISQDATLNLSLTAHLDGCYSTGAA